MADETLGRRRPIPWRAVGWGAAGAVLLVPLVAMQFTDEVAWDPADFAVAALLLGGTGLAVELAARRSLHTAHRAGAVVASGGMLALIWVNLAVGIVGSEGHPANLLYGVVLAVGAIGAVLGRFRPSGMVRAMLAMAVAQAGVAIAHLVAGHATLIIAGLFIALWLTSAGLFHRASLRDPSR